MLCGRGPSSHPSWLARACPPEHLEENGAEEGGGKDKEEGMSAWQSFSGSPARDWCKSFGFPLSQAHPTKNSLISDYTRYLACSLDLIQLGYCIPG